MKKKILAILLAVSCMGMMMTGCAGGEEEKEPEKQEEVKEDDGGESKEAESESGGVDAILADVEKQMNDALGELPESGKGERVGILMRKPGRN